MLAFATRSTAAAALALALMPGPGSAAVHAQSASSADTLYERLGGDPPAERPGAEGSSPPASPGRGS
jgi:hypothetical protein